MMYHIVTNERRNGVSYWTPDENQARYARSMLDSVCAVTEPISAHRAEVDTYIDRAYNRAYFGDYLGRTPTSLRTGLIALVLLVVTGCGGKVSDYTELAPVVASALLPLDDYATAICDRAATCGAPFEESIAQAVDVRPEDPDCAPKLAAWMREQPSAPDACLEAMAEQVRAEQCDPTPELPAACEGVTP